MITCPSSFPYLRAITDPCDLICSPIRSDPLSWPFWARGSYVPVILKLVCFVVRSIKCPPPDFVHPISEDVRENVECLLAVLKSGRPSDPGPFIHRLLFSMFCHQKAEGGDRQNFQDPIARAIILLSIRSSGRWREPDRVSPILARVAWGVRVVTFTEIVNLVEDDCTSESLRE